MVKVFIAGGNVGGSALISLLREEPHTEIAGIYEKKSDAPGALLARKWEIPVFHTIEDISRVKPEIIINVTGNPLLTKEIRKIHEGVEVIEGIGAQFLWDTIERQKRARIESMRTVDDQRNLFEFAQQLQNIEQTNTIFEITIERSLQITGCPVACILALEQDVVTLLAHTGFSKKLLNGDSRQVIPETVIDRVIKDGETIEVKNIIKEDYQKAPLFLSEKIRSFIAMPFMVAQGKRGLLFLGDYKPRQFSLRQKASLNLLLSVTGIALTWLEKSHLKGDTGAEKELEEQLAAKTSELGEMNKNLEDLVNERTDQLRKMNEELERANLMKSRFIANMSHELRTPLNSILGFSNVLLERTFGDLTENQQRYIENINSSGNYLFELINSVLDIAKIESGKLEVILETFRIEDVIQEVISTMLSLIDGKLGDFLIHIDDSIGDITADRIKLKQILYNLISNAIKFSPEGGKAGINVDKKQINSATYVQFSVWDTGIGISQEDQGRIFDEFEQADTALSRQYGGAGLGLSLTKKLVQIQAGDLLVESKLGEGSTFRFTLPIVSPVEKKIAVQPTEALSLDFPWMSEDAPLILVIEDDISTAELLTIHLTQSGYRVSHAYDGEEAIKKAKELKPFAVTLDVMLPKKDGWEVLQELKSDNETADIPVIIHSVVDNKDLAFALGATDYLLKPLDKDALLSKLEDVSLVKGKVATPTTILIVEQDEKEVEHLKGLMGDEKFLFYTADTGKRGMELAFALRPGLIILDIDLPDMQSFDFVKAMKDAHTTRDIPIFILSQKDLSVEDRLSLVGKIERIMKKHAYETKELINHIKELEILYPQKAGLIDELTGLFNHRYFQLRLAQEVERATRYKLPLILVLVDIDDFGNYVKEKGEHYANSVLKKVSELLKKNIRGSDVVVRYGGDAFAVLLPNTVLSAGLSLSNRFNAIIRNYPFLQADVQPRGKITVSVGLTFLDGQTPEEFILCSERALRKAIEKGGDRVEVYEEKRLDQSTVG